MNRIEGVYLPRSFLFSNGLRDPEKRSSGTCESKDYEHIKGAILQSRASVDRAAYLRGLSHIYITGSINNNYYSQLNQKGVVMTDLTTFISILLHVAAVLARMLGVLATIVGGCSIFLAHAADDAVGLARVRRYVAMGIILLALYAILRAPAVAEWLTGVTLG